MLPLQIESMNLYIVLTFPETHSGEMAVHAHSSFSQHYALRRSYN
jgi:hypothetical protein